MPAQQNRIKVDSRRQIIGVPIGSPPLGKPEKWLSVNKPIAVALEASLKEPIPSKVTRLDENQRIVRKKSPRLYNTQERQQHRNWC